MTVISVIFDKKERLQTGLKLLKLCGPTETFLGENSYSESRRGNTLQQRGLFCFVFFVGVTSSSSRNFRQCGVVRGAGGRF